MTHISLSISTLSSLRESQLVADMERQYGPLMGGTALYRALGLPSAAAFRQAASREVLPVQVFSIPHRRGRFALTREVALWLAGLKASTDGVVGLTAPEQKESGADDTNRRSAMT